MNRDLGESLIIEGRRALARKAQGKRASRPAVDGTHANKTRRPTLGFSPFPAVRHGHGLEAGRAVAATGHRIKHGLSRMQGAPGTVVIAVSAPETALAGAPSAAMALQQLALIPLGECARLVSAASTTQDPPGTCLQISARAQTIASHYRACDRQPSLQARIAIIAHSDITRIQPAMRAGPPQGRAQRYDWQIRAGWVGVAELRSLQGWPGVPPAAPKAATAHRGASGLPARNAYARRGLPRPDRPPCNAQRDTARWTTRASAPQNPKATEPGSLRVTVRVFLAHQGLAYADQRIRLSSTYRPPSLQGRALTPAPGPTSPAPSTARWPAQRLLRLAAPTARPHIRPPTARYSAPRRVRAAQTPAACGSWKGKDKSIGCRALRRRPQTIVGLRGTGVGIFDQHRGSPALHTYP
ncbi:hypothetical protein D555_0708 [Bordetella holmesii 35009]|nr:hypothetical protein D555_0708 [Bordetella holmesii 35009]